MIDRSESHLIAQERRNRGVSTNEPATNAGGRISRRKPAAVRTRVEPSISESKHAVPGTRLK
jgi:hypothetical protein